MTNEHSSFNEQIMRLYGVKYAMHSAFNCHYELINRFGERLLSGQGLLIPMFLKESADGF